jgi:hypothetical protein
VRFSLLTPFHTVCRTSATLKIRRAQTHSQPEGYSRCEGYGCEEVGGYPKQSVPPGPCLGRIRSTRRVRYLLPGRGQRLTLAALAVGAALSSSAPISAKAPLSVFSLSISASTVESSR